MCILLVSARAAVYDGSVLPRVAMPKTSKKNAPVLTVQAVIFLAADAMSMMVCEQCGEKTRVLDVLSQPVHLARDVFGGGTVTRDTMDRCVQVARGFCDLLDEYRRGGTVEVRLLATNILLDIRNMDTLVNRLQIACGLDLEVMDDGEMTRLLYLRVQSTLESHPELAKKRVLVVHVGPGNTRLLVSDKGRITFYSNYRIGAHRTGIKLGETALAEADDEAALIREHIRGTVEQIGYDVDAALPAAPDALLLIGPDFRSMDVAAAGESMTQEKMARLVRRMAGCPISQRADRYGETHASVSSLLPMVIIGLEIAKFFEGAALLCPSEEYAGAFLAQLMPARRDDTVLEEEVIHFSQLLAARYRTDKAHSAHIRKLSMALFDRMQELHGLSRHDRLVLKVAAILHEIGTFISPKNHHRHGQYIILNSEIFGLSRRDVEVVGLLARYHRHGAPTMNDSSYTELELPARLRVQKLAALLRVAEAMERAHSHRISEFTLRYNNRRIELLVAGVHDLSMENRALRDKGALFTDIFGYELILLPAEV